MGRCSDWVGHDGGPHPALSGRQPKVLDRAEVPGCSHPTAFLGLHCPHDFGTEAKCCLCEKVVGVKVVNDSDSDGLFNLKVNWRATV